MDATTTISLWYSDSFYEGYDYVPFVFCVLLVNDGVMFITMVLVIYQWYFVIMQQDIYTFNYIASIIWKIGVVTSVGAHTFGVAAWVKIGCASTYDGTIIFDIGYLYSIMFWFICFCWEYYKMSRRSFAASVNRNLNLSSFILNASLITLFEAISSVIPPIAHEPKYVYFSLVELLATISIGFLLTTIGLFIIIVKTYFFQQRQKKESSMMSNDRSVVIDRTVGFAVTMSIIGAITFTLSYPSLEVYGCLYWLLNLHVCVPWSMVFGCCLIFFNVVSVTIP